MDFLSISPAAMLAASTASLGFGASSLVGKKASEYASPATVMFVFMIPCMLVGIIWFTVKPDSHFTAAYYYPFAVSAVVNVIANVCYLTSIRISPISLAGSAMGLVPLFAALVARFELGEELSRMQWSGIVLSFIGLAVMYVPPRNHPKERHDFFAFFKSKGGWLSLLAALGWAIASPFDKLASQAASPQLHCIVIYAAMIPPSFLLIWWQKRLHELRLKPRHAGVILISGSLRGAGYIIQLIALTLMPVGIMEMVKRAGYQTISIIGGRVFFQEKITRFKLIGTAIFFVAIPMVVFK
ncbi:MAG: DMT family transporter [Alphaproteobacteria bacterium]